MSTCLRILKRGKCLRRIQVSPTKSIVHTSLLLKRMKVRLKFCPFFPPLPRVSPPLSPRALRASPISQATPLNAAFAPSAPRLSPRCRRPSSLLYPRFYSATAGGVTRAVTASPAQARRRSASNAGEVTAVLRVAGEARESGAPLFEGPDPEASLGAGSASVRYEGWAAPAIGARRRSPWTPHFLSLSVESIMPPPRPSSSSIPSRRYLA
jgi:hypothetical protein